MQGLKMIPLNDARRLAKKTLVKRILGTEYVSLTESLGRVLALDIVSQEDIPAFHRSTVDGFAVRAEDSVLACPDKPVSFRLIGGIRMGRNADMVIAAGEAAKIPTGGMLPTGADSVIMQEYSVERPTEGMVEIWRKVEPFDNVIRQGEDARAGEILLKRGRRICAADLGVLASCGFGEVPVICRPLVILIGTGDEIVSPSIKPAPGQVRDVNTYTLGAMVKNCGCDVNVVPRVPDDPDILFDVLGEAATKADIILISGGSSVGERDYTLNAAMRLDEAELVFHGIALKPGKPAALIRVGTACVFGIPGHIVSAMTVFREIVQPAINAMMGLPVDSPLTVKAVLSSQLRPGEDRDEFFYVRLESADGQVHAIPIPGKSGWVTMLSRADGMIFLPARHPGLFPGQEAEVMLLEGRYPQITKEESDADEQR